MVRLVRRGVAMREVARRFRVSLLTVQRWVGRAGGEQRLMRVDWTSQKSGRRRPVNRTSCELEQAIVDTRETLRLSSDLGEFGALAIRDALIGSGTSDPPSVRTIGRVLVRSGVLDHKARIRRPPPPPGWYLPAMSDARSELDSFDTVNGLVLRGGIEVEVLNGISLHGGLITCWPSAAVTAATVVERLIEHWRAFGCPAYAQFDNATIFQGPHQFRDVVGRVMRLCLQLGIVPVFAPPREPGFQASVESLNGRWQAKVWARFEHESLMQLQQRSDRYVTAVRNRAAPRIERAPIRLPFPDPFDLDFQAHPAGKMIFIRRTDSDGAVSLLGHRFAVSSDWPYRLVRSEVDLDHSRIRFFALRRREPDCQPLLAEHRHVLPRRRFLLRD